MSFLNLFSRYFKLRQKSFSHILHHSLCSFWIILPPWATSMVIFANATDIKQIFGGVVVEGHLPTHTLEHVIFKLWAKYSNYSSVLFKQMLLVYTVIDFKGDGWYASLHGMLGFCFQMYLECKSPNDFSKSISCSLSPPLLHSLCSVSVFLLAFLTFFPSKVTALLQCSPHRDWQSRPMTERAKGHNHRLSFHHKHSIKPKCQEPTGSKAALVLWWFQLNKKKGNCNYYD